MWVPEPGTYRSYVEAQSVIQLVDNDQLDWERPHGVFLAGAVVEWLRGDDRTEVEAGPGVEPMARVTDGVLTGWVHRCCLELVPVRPQTALERLVGPDDL